MVIFLVVIFITVPNILIINYKFMSTGTYGVKRSATVSASDVEIYYTFQANKENNITEVKTLNPSNVLAKLDHPDNVGRILGGMYTLKLPTTVFNTRGIYNILIRPKEISARILDCGVLSSKPDIKGIIFDLNELNPTDLATFQNGGLIGFRIEYMETSPNTEEKKILNLYRIITSNFRVEPVSENLTNTTQKGLRYRINENSNLVFCTLTPSSAPSATPNAIPFIGIPNQDVILTNTFFDPIMVTVELVEHDFDTLAIGMFGDQTLGVKDGIRTYYNESGEIYKQFDEYVIKDDVSEESLFEVKEERDNIDFTKNIDDISVQ